MPGQPQPGQQRGVEDEDDRQLRVRQQRRILVSQRLGGQPDRLRGPRQSWLGRPRGALRVRVVAELRHRFDAGARLRLRPGLDRAALAERAPPAELGGPLLHLPAGEAVRLPGAGPDRPLPAEPVGGRRPVQQLPEHPALAVLPVLPGPHRPVRRRPHPALVDQPALLGQRPVDLGQAGHLRGPRLAGPALTPCRFPSQRPADRPADAGVEVPGVLLPQQLVPELADVPARPGGHRVPDPGQGQQTVPDER